MSEPTEDDLYLERAALLDLVWQNVATKEHRRRLCEVCAELAHRREIDRERQWKKATRQDDGQTLRRTTQRS